MLHISAPLVVGGWTVDGFNARSHTEENGRIDSLFVFIVVFCNCLKNSVACLRTVSGEKPINNLTAHERNLQSDGDLVANQVALSHSIGDPNEQSVSHKKFIPHQQPNPHHQQQSGGGGNSTEPCSGSDATRPAKPSCVRTRPANHC